MTRKPARLLVLAVTAAATAAVAPAPAQAAVPYCGITWGSTAKASNVSSTGTVEGVRAGRHACFDRLVVDLDGHWCTLLGSGIEKVLDVGTRREPG